MSQVITFYSYKGGVGRTMALANIAVILANWGKKVLVVDWDLEAPGLEHFYKEFIEITVTEKTIGVIDLLQKENTVDWQEAVIPIPLPELNCELHFISSGKRDEDYFNKVRAFDIGEFYQNNGGVTIEKLRTEWLEKYDFVLIDSRTGITEIGGVCTIQLPDIIVMLFTATDQGFEGTIEIMKRASAAQQKLPYDRERVVFLPVVSKFETNAEFKLSQYWLEQFSDKLQPVYGDWLLESINRKEFLELTKIPYISYFSFGEKLPVIEQGVKDPSGLGYAYETLSALIAQKLNNAELLFDNRDKLLSEVNSLYSPSSSTLIDKKTEKLRRLKHKLNITSGEIKEEKSIQTVSKVIKDSLLPLCRAISYQMNQIGTLFKNREEEIEITWIDRQNENHYSKEYSLNNSGSIINEMPLFTGPLSSLSYLYRLSSFRKLKDSNAKFNAEIYAEFHSLVVEIKSSTNNVSREILYHETLSEDAISMIASEIVEDLLEKISVVIN